MLQPPFFLRQAALNASLIRGGRLLQASRRRGFGIKAHLQLPPEVRQIRLFDPRHDSYRLLTNLRRGDSTLLRRNDQHPLCRERHATWRTSVDW